MVDDAFILEAEMPGEGRTLLVSIFELHYLAGKLNGEAGELAEEVFKATRDDGGVIERYRYERIVKELGDVQWYLAQLSRQIGCKLSYIAEENTSKLRSRLERDLLHGDGDNR